MWAVVLVSAGSAGIYSVDKLVVEPRHARERALQEQYENEKRERERVEGASAPRV